ncbi:hypothetical protein [Micrococcoides hystricis]|uniref:DUF222 domain-containing protein n=1 Tax=Micrococcoides hystricis TaxID=1572761 RepID=A0ABV6P8W9_9MICC
MSPAADFSLEKAVTALSAAAVQAGAKPFKGATGVWAGAVEIAVLDTVLSIGEFQPSSAAAVLPRLRAFKAFRGPSNMMRVLAMLGPAGLADFVQDQKQIDLVLKASGALLDAGINGAEDVATDGEAAKTQREALLSVVGVPECAWEYFLLALGLRTPETDRLQKRWISRFISNTTGATGLEGPIRDSLLQAVTERIDTDYQQRYFGRMPTFTLPQLRQAILRVEYFNTTG